MKPLKKRVHAGRDDVDQAGESVLVAARVFGNYVLVPAAGYPDEATARLALHGAALLVFADQRDQVIHLAAGDAAHVARDAALRPRKNVSNEIVSSHEKTSEQCVVNNGQLKEKTEDIRMTREVHCSACDALIPQGATVCPGCGLPLTAQAVPAVYVEEPRFPLWGVILVAVVVMILVCELFGK